MSLESVVLPTTIDDLAKRHVVVTRQLIENDDEHADETVIAVEGTVICRAGGTQDGLAAQLAMRVPGILGRYAYDDPREDLIVTQDYRTGFARVYVVGATPTEVLWLDSQAQERLLAAVDPTLANMWAARHVAVGERGTGAIVDTRQGHESLTMVFEWSHHNARWRLGRKGLTELARAVGRALDGTRSVVRSRDFHMSVEPADGGVLLDVSLNLRVRLDAEQARTLCVRLAAA